MKFEKETRNLIFLFFGALILRIIFSFSFFVHWWDESVYLSLGYDLSKNFFHYSLSGLNWSDYIPFGNFPYYWPNIGFRAPLLPYTLSIFYFLKLDFLVDFFNPIVGALSSIVVYFLGKEVFNKKVGIYSDLIFAFIPFNILENSMVMTGTYATFFVVLSFLFFWKGFEKGQNNYKIFFGISLALAVLSRYTVLWIFPVFLFYFLIRDKNFNFLKDRYFWYGILSFFVVLIPWFVYGYHFYGNLFGGFIHGVQAASYWGGVQSFLFYFQNSWEIFSIAGMVFVVSLFYFFKNNSFKNRGVYLFLIWIFFFLMMACFVPHKEERFLLPIFPAISVLSGLFLISLKKYSKTVFILVLAVLLVHGGFLFVHNYNENHTATYDCFNKATLFLGGVSGKILVISNEPPIVYPYVHQRVRYYPNPWSIENLKKSINSTHDENDTYIFYTDLDMPLYKEENVKIKDDLDNSFEKVFTCDHDWGLSTIYKF